MFIVMLHYLEKGRINLFPTERVCRTREYWRKVVAERTERGEIRTKTTEGQYSPVRLEQARLGSSLLYGARAMLGLEFASFRKQKNTQLTAFSMETVRMAKSRPRKKTCESERSELPQDYLAIY